MSTLKKPQIASIKHFIAVLMIFIILIGLTACCRYPSGSISIDGLVNVRDIGGKKTVDGKMVKTGMLLRGSEADGVYESEYLLTDEGKKTLRNYHIALDADLRYEDPAIPAASPLGDEVKHKIYSLAPYRLYDSDGKNEAIRSLFSDLSNEENYPVYIHCTYGVDRSGTACYVLEALLGYSEEQIMKDYALSATAFESIDIDSPEAPIRQFHMEFMQLPGNTLKEKAKYYLHSVGVTENQTESIIGIMT